MSDHRYDTTHDYWKAIGLCNCDREDGLHKWNPELCYPRSRFQTCKGETK